MSFEFKDLIDRARTLSLPVELVSGASENRGMSRFIFPDGKIDRQLTPSGHLLLQETP